jgi:hypothetical protein
MPVKARSWVFMGARKTGRLRGVHTRRQREETCDEDVARWTDGLLDCGRTTEEADGLGRRWKLEQLSSECVSDIQHRCDRGRRQG